MNTQQITEHRSFLETLMEICILLGNEHARSESEGANAITPVTPSVPVLDIIRRQREGRPGVWETVIEWASEFEELNKDRQWDGEFYEEIDAFVTKKINEL